MAPNETLDAVSKAVRVRYDDEVDAMAIELGPRRGRRSARTVRVTDTVRLDFDGAGRLLTVEVLDARWHVKRPRRRSSAEARFVESVRQGLAIERGEIPPARVTEVWRTKSGWVRRREIDPAAYQRERRRGRGEPERRRARAPGNDSPRED